MPKNLPPGPRPLLVRFHGGGWTEGEAEASLRPFFLELALKHGAVILTPDYRLRPEHELTDGIDDVRSFWKWVEQHAARVLQEELPSIDLDNSNLLIGGESAGGHLAVQSALLGLTRLPIKVLFIQYPPLDLADLFKVPDIPGDADRLPYSLVEEHLASQKPGSVCTRARFGSRMDLMGAMLQAGKFCDVEGENAWIDPMTSLQSAGNLPPILLYHSKEDEALPWKGTEKWAGKLKELQPEVPLYLSYQSGSHTFDRNDNMATPWLKGPLEFVQSH